MLSEWLKEVSDCAILGSARVDDELIIEIGVAWTENDHVQRDRPLAPNGWVPRYR